MTTLPALSLWQPWATLCVTRQRCDHAEPWASLHMTDVHPMVKRFETRSFPAPQRLVGQRILIHATARRITHRDEQDIGDWQLLPDGDHGWSARHTPTFAASPAFDNATATVHAIWPDTADARRCGYHRLPFGAIVGSAVLGEPLPIIGNEYQGGCRVADLPEEGRFTAGLWLLGPHDLTGGTPTLIEDQRPYGDWSAGRWAWPLHDAAPTTERCPNCWGTGEAYAPNGLRIVCICGDSGRCDPIPAKGRQQIGWPCNLESLAVTA